MSEQNRVVSSLLKTGELRLWEPSLKGKKDRVLFMTKDLFKAVDNIHDAWLGQLQDDFDHFCSGAILTVGYGATASCFLKLLRHADEEVWELRCKGIKPQLRVFGRFLKRNVLFLTNYDSREETDFESQKRICKEKWLEYFPNNFPLTGQNFNDYLAEPIHEVSSRPQRRKNS